uniref:Pentatricopeptide repeat-containing protein n=1 Tax=Daucus carota subsp. sativus TaxID=79200 RepID=A0A162A6S1_DAUCS
MIDSLVISLKRFATQGHLEQAFKTFASIQTHFGSGDSFYIIVISLSRLLLCCSNLKALSHGRQVHSYIVTSGLEKHSILVPKLVTFYANLDVLDYGKIIVCSSGIKDPLSWNLLISGYVRNGFCGEAISMYRVMVEKGVRPDNFTYPSVLKACSEELDVVAGREVHRSIECSGVEWNLYVYNALIYMYGKCGEVDVARKLFDGLRERDAVSWNSMISCYASGGMWKEAFEVFEYMQGESIELNMITWNTIAGGCLKTGRYDTALELLCRMRKCLIHLDPVAVINGLGACSHVGSLKLGKEIHGLAVRSYCDEFDKVRNSLITMYSRCKDLRLATVLFNLVQVKSMITWNSIISGYSQWDHTEEAFFLFREMILFGFEPNNVTIASLLPLCARVANLQHGREFHCYMIKREVFKDYLLLWNALVDMYARSGKISLAKRLFDLLIKKDEVTYTSLIAGYGIQGEGKTALKLFEEMIASQIRPDHVTMIAVLSACSHSRLVIEAIAVGKFLGIAWRHLNPVACGIITKRRCSVISCTGIAWRHLNPVACGIITKRRCSVMRCTVEAYSSPFVVDMGIYLLRFGVLSAGADKVDHGVEFSVTDEWLEGWETDNIVKDFLIIFVPVFQVVMMVEEQKEIEIRYYTDRGSTKENRD